jgi:hypothetical protein
MTRFTLFVLSFLCAAILTPEGLAQEVKAAMKRAEETDIDRLKVAKRARSLLRWDGHPDQHLDVRRWIFERDLKDQEVGWVARQRLAQEPERMGRIVSCIGECWVYRNTIPTKARWLSRVMEGDEVHTGAGSYLWMALTDGALVRLAPETSVSMLEMNFTADEVFFQARLNQGYINWIPRTGREQKLTDAPETDPLFLPLMDPEANVGWFQQRDYRAQNDQGQILLTTSPRLLGQESQYKALNKLIKENNAYVARNHRYLLVSPNASVMATNVGVNWFYGTGLRSYFKLADRAPEEEGSLKTPWKAEFYYRGYANAKVEEITDEGWRTVLPSGREMITMEQGPPGIELSELLVKRLPTFMLVRERWLARDRNFWIDSKSPEKLATNWGFKTWDKDLARRVEYLKESTRRMETSNLRSLEKLVASLAVEGKPIISEFDARYFARALDSYYLGIKRRHGFSPESIRDMSALHYYGWVLRNSRQN